jgi:EAL domain-containing protein (putative c-di-GMP-specific phosphodiesterase class I)/GGDEF domain-containing protein
MLISRGQLGAIDAAIAEHAGVGRVGVLLVHLRGIRQLVALLGFEAGTALMDATAARLTEVLRPLDRIWRTGPDEFLIVLPGLLGSNHGILAARKVLREFESPLSVQDRPMTPLLSLALAVATDSDQNREQVIRRAMSALDHALVSNSRFVLASEAPADLWLQDDLRDALVNNELSVEFQPIFRIANRQVVTVEALARWRSPRHGLISPNRFIALAEQAGLAPELTRWSINAVLREYAPLRRRRPDLRCALNLSPKVFSLSGVEEQILAALKIWDIPATALTLEVTETAVMDDPELSSATLRNLRDRGVRVAIDDFGQGYSSFTYLKHFPATELKIDQSFVTPMAIDHRAHQLVRSMIGIAHHLGMEAVAEGVEDAATLEQLAALGCDLAQGYHLGRPADAIAILAELDSAEASS